MSSCPIIFVTTSQISGKDSFQTVTKQLELFEQDIFISNHILNIFHFIFQHFLFKFSNSVPTDSNMIKNWMTENQIRPKPPNWTILQSQTDPIQLKSYFVPFDAT